MKQAIVTRLFTKRRYGIDNVGFVRQQRFYPVPGVADGDELLVTEICCGSPSWSGEYSVRLKDGVTIKVGFSIVI
jgi:hypothetical protein